MTTLAPIYAKDFLWRSALLTAVLWVSACGGGDSTGPSGQGVALRTVVELAGANCPTGGTKIEAGPDSNANGVLDTSEVNSTAYVCSGQAGLTGAAGLPGAAGIQGLTGAIGATGLAGATGPAGPAGPSGPAGVTGTTGLAGAPGATGPAGATGTIGLTGPSGPQGATGTAGVTGATGPAGATGTTGPIGATGPAGPSGQGTVIQSCNVAPATFVVVANCGDLTTGISVLIQAGPDTGKGVPDDPAGITSAVLLCGAGSPIGSVSNPTVTDPKTGLATRVTCSTIF
jgi:collagen type I alpha